MKRIFRILSVGLGVIAIVGTAAAQTPSGVLNTLEVQRLVAVDTPAAHATLGRHFVALAHRYDGDAARFTARSTAPHGNPNHASAAAPDARHARQAEAAALLAKSARAMASYHQLLSIGWTPSAPVDRARFDGGLGAAIPTTADVERAGTSARTRDDHRTLVEYFLTVAARQTASANDHAIQARMFRVSGPRGGAEFAAMHCDRLAKLSRAAAARASAAALLHRQLASIG
jgi:hypothetical protein